jgi:hypothetical protein
MQQEDIVEGGYYQKGSKVYKVIEIKPKSKLRTSSQEPLVYHREYDKNGKGGLPGVDYLYYFAWKVERRVQPRKNPLDKAMDDHLVKMSKAYYQKAKENVYAGRII